AGSWPATTRTARVPTTIQRIFMAASEKRERGGSRKHPMAPEGDWPLVSCRSLGRQEDGGRSGAAESFVMASCFGLFLASGGVGGQTFCRAQRGTPFPAGVYNGNSHRSVFPLNRSGTYYPGPHAGPPPHRVVLPSAGAVPGGPRPRLAGLPLATG